jgi:methionyl-tRNA formyltransferase
MSELGLGSIVKESLKARIGVLLLGDGPTSLTALRSLLISCNVLGVLQTAESPVRAHATRHGIAVWSLKDSRELRSIIEEVKPDAVVISSFNRILPEDLLATSCFINVHYSPLPRYRGRANVNWAIINGEETAAISIHRVTPGLDDGNLLFQEQVVIGENDTVQLLYDRLNVIQERELGRAVVRAVAGDPGVPQDHQQATYCCGRVPDDGEIDWNRSCVAIGQLIRALGPPFPGAFTYVDSHRLVIARAEPKKDAHRFVGRVPGRIVGRSRSEGWVDVLTGDGVLRVFDVIPDNAAESMLAATVIRSTRTTLGLSRLDLLRHITSLERRLAALETSDRVSEADESSVLLPLSGRPGLKPTAGEKKPVPVASPHLQFAHIVSAKP